MFSRPRRRSALERVYREHVTFVWRALRRYGVPDAELDDLVHEVFVVVQKHEATLAEIESLRGWLYGIARNVAYRFFRAHTRRVRRQEHAPPPNAPVAPDDALLKLEAFELVEAFLLELDEAHREVFALCEVEGMRSAAVAVALDVNENTVRSRLRIARQRFAAWLRRQRLLEEGRCADA